MKDLSKRQEIIALSALIIIFVILKLNVINLPYFWDELGVYARAGNWVYENNLNVMPGEFPSELSRGHPPMFFFLLGAAFKIFGNHLWVAHSLELLFACITLTFSYLIMREYISKLTALATTTLIMLYPMFFSQSAIATPEVLIAAFSVMLIYFFIKNKMNAYQITGFFLVLLKPTAFFVIAAILVYLFIKNIKDKKRMLTECLVYGFPIIYLLLFFAIQKIKEGWFLFPYHTSLFNLNLYNIMITFDLKLSSLLIGSYYMWITWIILFIYILKYTDILTLAKNKIFLLLNLVLILAYIAISKINFLINLASKFFPVLDSVSKETLGSIFYARHIILILCFLTILIAFFKREHKKERIIKDTSTIYITILIYTAFFSVMYSTSRYFLVCFPLIIILFGVCLERLTKNRLIKIAVIAIIALLFISSWNLKRDLEGETTGGVLETNMEYNDIVTIHQQSAKFIEQNFPDSTILTAFPGYYEMTQPELGYVNKKFNVIDMNNYEVPRPCNNCIYYYSKQGFSNEMHDESVKNLNLSLIKEFSINNKTTEIYLVQS